MARTYQTTNDVTEEPTQITASRARGASWGRHILWVLIISTALAALALLGSLAFHSNAISGPGPQTRTPAGAQSFDTQIRPPVSAPTS